MKIVMMDATSLSEAIRSRKLSCVEVMSAYLSHIADLNPKVNAIINMRSSSILMEEAQRRDQELAKGIYHGVLHGFPFAIKDLESVKGMKMSMGSPILKDFVPTEDGLVPERIKNSGAIIIGKTNTPEFGLGSHTYNSVHGRTLNAYNQKVCAGGSSGGAAVGVALRMLPVADGSDYGGSLRNPAGWNNIYSLRPSFGRVPLTTGNLWLPSIAVHGPIARNINDLTMLLGVLLGEDLRSPLSLDSNLDLSADALNRDMKGIKVGWLGDLNSYLPFEKGVLAHCKEALKTCENMGCIVEETEPIFEFEKVWNAFKTIRAWQTGSILLKFYQDPKNRKLLKPEAIYEVESGAKLSAFDISDAGVIRAEWYTAFSKLFEKYDYLVLPTAQLYPFDVNMDWPKEIDGHTMKTYHEWMKVECLISMTGCPVLTVPAGVTKTGKPMGLQIIAPNHHEVACLQFGNAYEKVTEWGEKYLPDLLR